MLRSRGVNKREYPGASARVRSPFQSSFIPVPVLQVFSSRNLQIFRSALKRRVVCIGWQSDNKGIRSSSKFVCNSRTHPISDSVEITRIQGLVLYMFVGACAIPTIRHGIHVRIIVINYQSMSPKSFTTCSPPSSARKIEVSSTCEH